MIERNTPVLVDTLIRSDTHIEDIREHALEKCKNATLGSNNGTLTASLVPKLSLGVSSDWEPAGHTTEPRGGNWSSAALFSARCLVTMSWKKHREIPV